MPAPKPLSQPRRSRPGASHRARPGEVEALRVALMLAVGVLLSEVFVTRASPVPADDPEGRWAWLRRRLAPLTGRSSTVAGVCRLLDDRRCVSTWHTARGLTRTLRALATEARSHAQPSPRPRRRRAGTGAINE